jgi:hypothetical protein
MLLHRAPQPNMASTTCKHQTSHASISTAPPARSLTAPIYVHTRIRGFPSLRCRSARRRREKPANRRWRGGSDVGVQKFALYCSGRGGVVDSTLFRTLDTNVFRCVFDI